MDDEKKEMPGGAVRRRLAVAVIVVFIFVNEKIAMGIIWLGVILAGTSEQDAQKPEASTKQAEKKADPGFILTDLPQWGKLSVPSEGFDPKEQYVLLTFGLQGFYQTSSGAPAWNLLLPEKILEAQLIKRGRDGGGPELVTDKVKLFWEVRPQTELASSQTGNGEKVSRRGEMTLNADQTAFTVALPLSARQTDGLLNPYPVVTVTAQDAESGMLLAQSTAVLALSPGFGCGHCHADGKEAILEVHDRHNGTDFVQQAKKGQTVDCRSCHNGLTFQYGESAAGSNLGVSAALHGWHAQYLAGRGADACLSCHIGLGRSPDEPDSAARPLMLRDVHLERGLSCVSCHGFMEDHSLALLKAEEKAGQVLAGPAMQRLQPRSAKTAEDIKSRLPWSQEPSCAGCHDFNKKPDYTTASSFNHWTEDETGLFGRSSDEMGQVRCAGCHGAPHAVYPALNPLSRDRDNLPPLQYQEHARAMGAAGNCAVCHGEPMDDSAHHPLVERSRTSVTVPAGAVLTLPQVRVSHEAHKHIDCATCHHTGKEDGKPLACASSGCHDGISDAKTKDGGADPKYFRQAFHGPANENGGTSCFHCHSTYRQEGKPAGPTACKDCHTAPSPRWRTAN